VCLNPGKLLADTVQSVVCQTFPGVELIIKDGGSTDSSLSGLPKHPGIRLIAPDAGIYDAMNQALQHATGEYILFLNAGDSLCAPDVLSKLAIILEDHRPALLYSDYFKGPEKTLIRSPGKLTSAYLMRTMICHQVCFFRKSCYDRFGNFDTGFRVAADYDFLVRVIHGQKQEAVHYPHPAIIYRGGGYSIQHMPQSLEEVKMIRRNHFPPARLFIFYSWYLFTFPKLRQWLIERYKLDGYYRVSNYLKKK
jgi:glycosyltransferase involved in cell wall biosynthesis